MAVLSKLINRYNATCIKISVDVLVEVDMVILKFIQKCKGPKIAEMILKQKNKFGELTLPNFKTHYKATIINTGWHCHKDRLTDQWNQTDSSEINRYIYNQLIFDKSDKRIQWIR